MNDRVGAHATTLAEAASRSQESGQGLNDRIKRLIEDLEDDAGAIQGSALASFRRGQNELVAAMNGLTEWCSQNGMNLHLGQTKLTATDADSEEGYAQAERTLSREVNARV
jgi:uncharacterized protein YukE